MNTRARCILSFFIMGAAAASGAPEPAPPPPPAPSKPAAPAPKKPGDPIGGLDDLLGIPGAKKPAPPPGPDGAPPAEGEPGAEPDLLDPTKLELERQLTAAEAEHAYREAVREMGEAADRIEKGGDLGVVTQRLHEEILRKLDVVIKRAKDQDGSPSGEPQSGNADAKAQQQKQQTPSQPQMKENAQAGQGENRGEAMPPAPQAAQLRGQLDTARAAWGALPERVRESLLQGSNDYFSALYQAMTEAYYKKIAEEAKE